jgi:hypothetical protein
LERRDRTPGAAPACFHQCRGLRRWRSQATTRDRTSRSTRVPSSTAPTLESRQRRRGTFARRPDRLDRRVEGDAARRRRRVVSKMQADGVTLGGAAGTIAAHLTKTETAALTATDERKPHFWETTPPAAPQRTANQLQGSLAVRARRPRLHDAPRRRRRQDPLRSPLPRPAYAHELCHDGVYCRRLVTLTPQARRHEGLPNLGFVFTGPPTRDPAHGDGLLSAG